MIDFKREYNGRLGYTLVEDDSALLGGITFRSIVSGDKLPLLRDSPPESHVEPVAQLVRSPRDPMDNITNPADNNFEDNTNGFALAPYTEQRRAPSGVLAQQTMQRFGNAYFMGNSNNSTNNTTTSSAYSLATIGTNTTTYSGGAGNGGGGTLVTNATGTTGGRRKEVYTDGILLDCDTNRILSGGGGVDFRSANAPPLKLDEFERRDTQHQSFPAANNGRIVPSKKSGKKNMRKERGTTINVKELAGYFGDRGLDEILREFQPNQPNTGRTAPKKEKNGTDANAVVVVAAGDASAAVPMPPPEQKPQQQQPEITADNNEPSTKKGKQTKHVPSTAHRRTLTKQQRRRQQQQQLATQSRGSSAEDVEVGIELDREGGGGGGGVADVKRDQNIDPTLNAAETVAEAAASEVRNTFEKTKKPLLERIPSNVLRQLREKKAWHCPFTICNPFMNTGATAAVDRENVMKGPVEPWLERSDAFPLPAQLLQHGPMPMSKNGANVNVPTTL
ncbi:hypothetical protein niasHT_024609 [Heterodera trifolii]|uniref:Uncharacterized protein n=1 Tax=Heterodera trifolii TaxID=157864 RepID=A0ABD2K7V7_9BILA